jgi:uroporphyrin-III C-methyltransferase
MGLSKVEAIMETFAAHGKSDIPVAIVQNGSLPNQKSVIGTASSIASLAAANEISAPAIIIVGEVVRYAQALEKVVLAAKSMA